MQECKNISDVIVNICTEKGKHFLGQSQAMHDKLRTYTTTNLVQNHNKPTTILIKVRIPKILEALIITNLY